MNNPFGTDVILGEIIPADFMGTEVYDFRPSASDGNTTHADTIFFCPERVGTNTTTKVE